MPFKLAASMNFGKKLKKIKESSHHHRRLRTKTRKKRSSLTRVCTVNEEKNCAWAQPIQIQNRNRAAQLTAMNEYRQAQKKEKHLFRKKGNLTIRL
jgi:hypothetical protein